MFNVIFPSRIVLSKLFNDYRIEGNAFLRSAFGITDADAREALASRISTAGLPVYNVDEHKVDVLNWIQLLLG